MFKALKWAYMLGRKQSEHEYRYAFEKRLKSRSEVRILEADMIADNSTEYSRKRAAKELSLDVELRGIVESVFYPAEPVEYFPPKDRFEP